MSLVALLCGPLGQMFAGQTTTPVRLDRPVVFDVSSIGDSDTDLQGAALMACWSTGFAAVNVANVLADAGLEPRRFYFVVLDELHRALRAGAGMVDRVDLLTRLNREVGVGTSMITHTMADLDALPSPEDRAKARGFVERSAVVVTGGLPRKEIPALSDVVHFSDAETQLVTSWATPPGWDTTSGGKGEPPGRGRFLIKVGERPGIPLRTWMTRPETAISDSNRRRRRQDQHSVDTRLAGALDPDEQEWA